MLVEIPWSTRVWAPFALPLGSGSFRALCRRTGQTAQEADRPGVAAALAGSKALASKTRHRRGGRRHLRLSETAISLPKPEQTRDLRHPLRAGCRPLRTPAPPRRPGRIGGPRLKGERLPNLSVVAEDPATVRKPITIADRYGSGQRMVEITPATAAWYSTGLFAVPLRWVLVRDPRGRFKTQALLLCTDLKADPEEILSRFVMRWRPEATFREVRRHLVDSRPKGSARSWRYEEPHRRFRVCSRWLLRLRIAEWHAQRALFGGQPGSTRGIRDLRADALALMRKEELWAQEEAFYGSPADIEMAKVSRAFVERLTHAVCYAA